MSDKLPPEMWREIFAYSCTDDGHTGRSLSLVSKNIRLLSSEYKYQSLAVTCAKHILRLSLVLSDIPEELRQIRYLLLATPNLLWGDNSEDEGDGSYVTDNEDSDTGSNEASEGSLASSSLECGSLTEDERLDLADDLFFFDTPDGKPTSGPPVNQGATPPISADEEVRIAEDILVETVNIIITMASPSLIRLTLFLDLQSRAYAPFVTTPVPLSQLRELSLFCRASCVLTDTPVVPDSVTLFPILENLHVGRPGRMHKRLLHRIAHFAPRLANLRFAYDYSLFEPDDPWKLLTLLPDTLENVLVDIDPGEETLQDVFDVRAMEFEKYLYPRARLTVRRQEDIPSIKQDWLDRMVGRPGEWGYEEFVPASPVDWDSI